MSEEELARYVARCEEEIARHEAAAEAKLYEAATKLLRWKREADKEFRFRTPPSLEAFVEWYMEAFEFDMLCEGEPWSAEDLLRMRTDLLRYMQLVERKQ
jgi:hypothetical protein